MSLYLRIDRQTVMSPGVGWSVRGEGYQDNENPTPYQGAVLNIVIILQSYCKIILTLCGANYRHC